MDYRSTGGYQYYNPYSSIVAPTYVPPQSVQPQIRSGGIVTVANEDEARRYPVAPGYTVTMRDETGIFRLANNAVSSLCGCGCGCRKVYESLYAVTFHGNIAISEGGTAGPIQLSVSIDGEPDPSSTMIVTPAAVGDFQNVGAEIIVAVPSLCGCESISVRNTSTQAIDVQNANLTINYLGLRRVL